MVPNAHRVTLQLLLPRRLGTWLDNGVLPRLLFLLDCVRHVDVLIEVTRHLGGALYHVRRGH